MTSPSETTIINKKAENAVNKVLNKKVIAFLSAIVLAVLGGGGYYQYSANGDTGVTLESKVDANILRDEVVHADLTRRVELLEISMTDIEKKVDKIDDTTSRIEERVIALDKRLYRNE